MNLDTRKGYFRRWAAACRVQGWNPADEARRRDVTLTVTGKASSTDLDNFEITQLFRFLEWQADPNNLRKAMAAEAVADPAEALELNRCRQLIFVIEGLRFDDAYIARPAQAYCQEESKATWRELSSAALENLRNTLKTRARQRDAAAGERPEFVLRATPYHQRPLVKRKRAEKRAAEREQPYEPRPGVAENLDADLLPF